MEEKKFDKDINVRSKDDADINVGMTDEEIVKAYKYCVLEDGHCNDCPYEDYGCAISAHDILDLINRQKAEIERLTEELKYYRGELL